MTRQISQKTISTACGLTAGLNTPCQFHKFSTGLLGELFETSLPKYLQEMRSKWGEIQCTRVSGLAPTFEGGPIDDCVRQGSWCEEQQLAHGGPIPFLSCSKGRRGATQQLGLTFRSTPRLGHRLATVAMKPLKAQTF